MEAGELGLPIIRPQNHGQSPILNSYQTQVFLTFSAAVKETPIGKAIKSRIEADERATRLDGKMINSGRGAGRFETDRLAAWWLWRANDVGVDIADRDLEHFLDADQVDVLQVLWVFGVEPTQPIAIASDVSLLHMRDIPNLWDKDQLFDETPRFRRPAEPPSAMAALVTKYSTRKVYDAANRTSDSPDARVQIRINNIAILLNCLPGVCCIPGYSTGYAPPETPFGPLGGSGGGTPIYDMLPQRITQLAPGHEELVSSLALAYDNKSDQDQDRLRRALLRLGQAKVRMNDGDRALDLGIALEMLLLNSNHKGKSRPDQLSLQFRLRGSWLIANDPIERRQIYKDLNRVYDFRSQIAHNGFSNELDKMDYQQRQAMLSQHIGIAERILQKLIIDGSPSEWDSLILGAL